MNATSAKTARKPREVYAIAYRNGKGYLTVRMPRTAASRAQDEASRTLERARAQYLPCTLDKITLSVTVYGDGTPLATANA